MYQDINLQFSAAQAITATAASTNYLDLQAVVRDMGKGERLYFDIRVNTAFTSAGAATLVVAVQTADDTGFSTNLNNVTLTDAIPKASLIIGATIPITIDRAEPFVGRRYMRLNYTVATGPFTAGTLTAGIVISIQDPQVSYASGFAVL